MPRVIVTAGRVTNAKGSFVRGDPIDGSEADLKPLVDTGAARWAGGEPTWTLATPPAEYLERYPDGPNAALARRVLGQED